MCVPASRKGTGRQPCRAAFPDNGRLREARADRDRGCRNGSSSFPKPSLVSFSEIRIGRVEFSEKPLARWPRVSTRDQSPALQLNALREAVCEKVFTEKASGAQRDRPELRAALDYLRPGDTLAVWKLDRLARSVRQLVETAEDLAKREVGLRVLTQAIDTTSPGGRLVFHVFAAVAEFERELTLERTHAGLAQARALGRCGGRKPAMGPAEIKRAKAMLADPTITVEEVAQQLGVQSSTLYRHIPGGRSSLAQPA